MVGRPPSDNPLAERVIFRALAEERDAWVLAAKRAGLSLSAWMRSVLNREAAKAARAASKRKA